MTEIPIQDDSLLPQDPAPELSSPSPASLEIEELQKQLEQTKDLLLRKAADFDNYKRRVESDISSIIKRANEDLLIAILPIVDDLERSLKAARISTDTETLLKGIDLIYQKVTKTLESIGVKPLDTVGKEFNVDFHDALLQIAKADLPPQTVIEEVEKGYMLHDKVIRHAKVIVSTTPAENA
jgi:molecular chaperone GrpE